MQFLVIFLVCALAVGNAEEDCEERAEGCVESLLSSILGDTSEEEVCKELKTTIDCLRSAVDDCLSEEEKDEELEEGLQELEKVLKDNCNAGDEEEDNSEARKCFEDNEEYIYECVYEGTNQHLDIMLENIENLELNEDVLQCNLYASMSSCFVDKIAEKCGQRAAKLAQKDLEDMPPEVKAACDSAGEINAHTFELLDKKRK